MPFCTDRNTLPERRTIEHGQESLRKTVIILRNSMRVMNTELQLLYLLGSRASIHLLRKRFASNNKKLYIIKPLFFVIPYAFCRVLRFLFRNTSLL